MYASVMDCPCLYAYMSICIFSDIEIQHTTLLLPSEKFNQDGLLKYYSPLYERKATRSHNAEKYKCSNVYKPLYKCAHFLSV